MSTNIAIAEGGTADIVFDPNNQGYCDKVYHPWNPRLADREQKIHDLVVAANLPTITEFNIDYIQHLARMTDLSHGGTHLVANIVDLMRLGKNDLLWFRTTTNKPVLNEQDFFLELRDILREVQEHGIKVWGPSLFLTATPQGELHTILGDYGDMYPLRRPYKEDEVPSLNAHCENYLREVVGNFFPSLAEPIDAFCATL
jgi:hypothetical protein